MDSGQQSSSCPIRDNQQQSKTLLLYRDNIEPPYIARKRAPTGAAGCNREHRRRSIDESLGRTRRIRRRG
ncbi:hypothetical protein PSEUDO8O_140041 [Pseudomonas sp. 8O]|nr:hypothetical protein PSEUDO8O_140041 [Pseudomonas sp. 8O]